MCFSIYHFDSEVINGGEISTILKSSHPPKWGSEMTAFTINKRTVNSISDFIKKLLHLRKG